MGSFVLSAIPPEKQMLVVENLASVLRPGGVILFRDYARRDLAQLRFSARRRLDDSGDLFARQDGTLSYFFSKQGLVDLFCASGFFQVKRFSGGGGGGGDGSSTGVEFVKRWIVNRKDEKVMSRMWLQVVLERTSVPWEADTST